MAKYKTSDLSKLLGVTTNTIRRFEESGFLTPERDESAYRWYSGYDIAVASMLRLYSKCGFSHTEIREIMDNDSEHTIDLCNAKLKEIDAQILKLKHLRHWLKDNMYMMNNLSNIGTSFVTMDSLVYKYVLYSCGEDIFTEKEHLEQINKFMYSLPEVQLFSMFKISDLVQGSVMPYNGWLIKETDIKRFNLSEEEFDSQYICTYHKTRAVYTALETPPDKANNTKFYVEQRLDTYKKALDFIDDNGFNLNDECDIIEIPVNTLAKTKTSLLCIPIKLENERAEKAYEYHNVFSGKIEFKH